MGTTATVVGGVVLAITGMAGAVAYSAATSGVGRSDDPTPWVQQHSTRLDGSASIPSTSAPVTTFGRNSALSLGAASGTGGLDGHQPVVGTPMGPAFGTLDEDLAAWYDRATGNDLTPYPAGRGGLFGRSTGWTEGWAAKGMTIHDVQPMVGVSPGGFPPSAHLSPGEQYTSAETEDLVVEYTASTHPQARNGETVVHVRLVLILTTNQARRVRSTTEWWFNVVPPARVSDEYTYLGGTGSTTGRRV